MLFECPPLPQFFLNLIVLCIVAGFVFPFLPSLTEMRGVNPQPCTHQANALPLAFVYCV